MKLIIDATEVAEQLAKCQPGDSELITIEVTSNDGETLEGTAIEIEHLTGEENYDAEESEPAEEAMPPQPARSKKVPKAIMVVAAK